VLVQQQGAAAGASFEDFHASRPAAFKVDDRGEAMAQTDAHHHRGRGRGPQSKI